MICILLSLPASAAPVAAFVPDADAQVLERLPRTLASPATPAPPRTLAAALARAREFVAIARREGDLRYLGYAEGLLARWWRQPDPAPAVRLLRARVRQARHRFDLALADLDAVLDEHPGSAQALLLRAGIELAAGRVARARRSCAALHRNAAPILVATCTARVDRVAGAARTGYRRLHAALARSPQPPPGALPWALGTLGELAAVLGDTAAAERHYRDALAAGGRDAGVLAHLADLLLDSGRPHAVQALLAAGPRTDALLLRRAEAARALGSPEHARLERVLAARFEQARLRGLRLHLREAARAALTLRNRPDEALELALAGWSVHREPADARLVLEAAVAAARPADARDVAAWIRHHGTEDARLQILARSVLDGDAA